MEREKRLIFSQDGIDPTSGIELRNGKASIWGWSTYEVWHKGDEVYPGAADERKIADLYCGEPINLAQGIEFRFEN